jgi:hypothetical protein
VLRRACDDRFPEGSEMNCFVCATEGRATVAVATCRYCDAALCMDHVAEQAALGRVGGMFMGCTHDTWAPRRAVIDER